MKIKGTVSAFIGLFSDIKTTFIGQNFYEIVLGTASNTAEFRKVGGGTALASGAMTFQSTKYLPFWLSWEGHTFSLGTGEDLGQNVIFTYKDTANQMAINHLAFSSSNSNSNRFFYYDGKSHSLYKL